MGVVVGKLMKIEDVPKTNKGTKIDWLDVIKGIPMGSAVEVDCAISTVRLGIKALVEKKKVRENEFLVVTRRSGIKGKEGYKVQVFLVHSKVS